MMKQPGYSLLGLCWKAIFSAFYIIFLVLPGTTSAVAHHDYRAHLRRHVIANRNDNHQLAEKQLVNVGSTRTFTVTGNMVTVTVWASPDVPEETTSSSAIISSTESSTISTLETTSTAVLQATVSSLTPSETFFPSKSTTSSTSSVAEPLEFGATPLRAAGPSTSSRSSLTSTSRSSTRSRPTMASFDPVIGAGNTCADRLKIDDLQTRFPENFNLLLLAWRELQLADESDDLSFYSLARVHGAPFGPWQMPANGDYNWQTGYCTHHSAIFLSWHRPFLALFEQTLYLKAAEIARRFTGADREKFIIASAGVRLPYWDWSDPITQSHLPRAVTVDTVSVVAPGSDGSPISTTIPNPLKSYTFHNRTSISSFWSNFGSWQTTLRQPNAAGRSNEGVADRALQAGFTSRRQATYLAFSLPQFNDFSQNIETIHDDVHESVGGAGHMTYIPYSAFDPVFWLHHSNMDRLMAMYQASRPDTFIEPLASIPTFANPSSARDTVDTPLYPFRHPDGSFWTSQDVSTAESIFMLSYGYPEVPCSMTFTTFGALQNLSTTEINRLYGPNTIPQMKRSLDTEEIRVEWQAKVVMDQRELPGSIVVYIFLGKPHGDHNEWKLSKSLIGQFTHLGAPGKRMWSRVIGSSVVLTDSVKEELGGSPTEEDILTYLRDNLTWTVLSDGNPIDTTTLRTLRVSCISTQIKLPGCPSELPEKGKDTYHLEVTTGKPCGARTSCDVESPFKVDGSRTCLPQHISISH